MKDEKISLYFDFIDTFIDMLHNPKSDNRKVKAMATRIQRIALKMSVLSSDDTMEAYLKWRAVSSGDDSPEEKFKVFAQFIIAMRRDIMGMGAGLFTEDDVLDILV